MKSVNNIWLPYITLKEPFLSFHIDQSYKATNKLEGLFRWGPFDISIPANPLKPVSPIKMGIILPRKIKALVEDYINKLNESMEIDDDYLRPYKGFREVYGVNIDITSKMYIESNEIFNCTNEKDVLNLFLQKIQQVKNESTFDVLLIIIPEEFESYLEIRKENYYFHLHDKIKLFSASNNIRTQIIRQIRIHNFQNRKQLIRSIWWLSGAIYVKAGGVLYRLAEFDERVLYIGLSYAITQFTTSQKILIGVAQLFDEQGNNIRIDLFPTSEFTIISKNPFLTERSSRSIFQKILEIYKSVKMRSPSKVIIYKTTPFNKEEIKGIKQAFSAIDRFELLWIQRNSFYRGIRLVDNRRPHSHPLLRGTVIKLDNRSFLIWTSGSIEIDLGRYKRNYYQEGRHIPKPLILKRFYGQDTIEEVAFEIMKLTKMNWNNLQYYNKLPVTIDFASRIAKIAKQAEHIPNILPKDFRYYI